MLIEYKNVNVYQDDREVLRGVDFHVDEGEFIYIIGKVGTGKSSFLKTIYCELDIDEEDADTAEVLGRNLKTLRRREVPALRKELGVIFQDFQLLHDRSVWENLQFVLKSTGWKDKAERAERIEKVLADVGMSDKKHNMPYELSGGEQQRIAIARAILNNPKVIIADEPTGNLDLDTATNIVALLRDITQSGTAVVMSTHNLSMLSKYPGIVYRCGDGKIKEVTNNLFKGLFLVSFYQSLIALFLYLIFGIEGALLLAILTFFSSFLPFFGCALVWVPLGIEILLTAGLLKGILFWCVAGFFISSVDNFLRPMFLQNRIQIHPLLIFFSILGGIRFFKLNGIVLGPMFVILLFTLIDIARTSDSTDIEE